MIALINTISTLGAVNYLRGNYRSFRHNYKGNDLGYQICIFSLFCTSWSSTCTNIVYFFCQVQVANDWFFLDTLRLLSI